MRAPPPVAMALPADAAWRLFEAGVSALSAAVLSLWLGLHLEIPIWPTLALAVASCALAGAALAWHFGREAAAVVRWTGAQWLLEEAPGRPAALAAVQVMIDLDAWLLLRLTEEAAPRRRHWRALRRPADPALWAAFRAAVYSPASRTGSRSEEERQDPP